MAAEKTVRMIVLHTTKLGDNSLVLHALTEDSERESFVVKGLKKTHAGVYFYPLSLLSAGIVKSPRASMSLAHQFAFSNPLEGIRGNMAKASICIFMAEVIYKLPQCDIPYSWICSQVESLDKAESGIAGFHIGFLIGLCEVLGFKLTPESLGEFGGQAVKESLTSAPENGEARARLCNAIISYLCYNLDTRIAINSIGVLSEILR